MWLLSQGKSKQNAMFNNPKKTGLPAQKWTELSNRLEELHGMKLIEIETIAGADNSSSKVFSLTDRGKIFATKILELEENLQELWKFESFKDVKKVS